MKKICLRIFLFSLITTSLFAKEIQIPLDGGSIYGILSPPEQIKSFPLVVIVPGSGATDKDGNSGNQLMTDSYKQLAEELKSYNIAAFRYDKRLIGKSQFQNLKEENLSFEMYVEDLVQIIKFLKKTTAVSDIFLLGHSEGSLISILAAQKESVTALISLAGVGINASDLIQTQVDSNEHNPEFIKKEVSSILSELRSGKKVKTVPPYLYSLFRESVQPYLISWFKFLPTAEIQKLSIPCLIINGDADIQVPAEHAKLLHKNCKDGQMIIIPNMTHTLKEISNPDEQLKTYLDPTMPVSQKLIESIVNFITM